MGDHQVINMELYDALFVIGGFVEGTLIIWIHLKIQSLQEFALFVIKEESTQESTVYGLI